MCKGCDLIETYYKPTKEETVAALMAAPLSDLLLLTKDLLRRSIEAARGNNTRHYNTSQAFSEIVIAEQLRRKGQKMWDTDNPSEGEGSRPIAINHITGEASLADTPEVLEAERKGTVKPGIIRDERGYATLPDSLLHKLSIEVEQHPQQGGLFQRIFGSGQGGTA